MAARLRQGFRALAAWVRPVDQRMAALYLTPPLLALFEQMRAGERQHSLNVLRDLLAQGESNPSLMIAALLHDVGKSRAPFWLWERAFVVIAKALVPARVARWGNPLPNTPIDAIPRGWRRPFVINKQHPAWSAHMTAAAGADPLSVELIARHQRTVNQGTADQASPSEADRLLRVLQAADDHN